MKKAPEMGATQCRWSAVAAGLLALATAGRAEAYGVRLRWQPADSPVTGYRVHVWAGDGVPESIVDVGLPAADIDGTLSAVVTGLDPQTEYALAVSATLATGAETPPSNIVRTGYAQAASVVDSDDDGIKDATDTCPDTPAGAPVDASGCACSQITCNDANPCAVAACDPTQGCTSTPVADGTPCADPDPCLPTGTCTAGTCTLPVTDVAPAGFLERRLTLRPVQGGRAWRVVATATVPGSGRSRLDPRDTTVELWAAGATLHYQESVPEEHFAPRPRRLIFAASAEHMPGGLRHLEIIERDGVRTIHFRALLPAVFLPGGAATPLTWLVRFGDQCARDLAMTCDTAGRGFVCPSAR